MEELQPQDIEEILQELEDEYDTAAAGVQRHLQAAYAHLRSEQFQNALHECDLVIQLDPTCYEAHNVRGLVLAQLGRKQEASGAFREALRLDPDFEAAKTNLQEIEALPEDDVDVSVETQGRRFGIRAGAYIIDAVAYLVLTNTTRYVVAFFLSAVLTLAGREFYLEERSLCLNLFVGLVLSALYFAIFEWLYGASLGKLVLGMCVVMESGERCTFGAALIRAGLRYVDGLFFGVPAYATMKPPLYQRIGDKSARTIVVDAKDPAIRQPRAGWWFLVAAVLYLALDGITSLLLLAPTLRLGGAMVTPELPAPIPVATFPPAVRTPPPPVLEAMRQLEPGWTSYMTGDELRENIEPGAVLAGGFWADIAVASDGTLWFVTLGGGVLHFDGETWTPYTEDDGLASNIGLSSTAGRGPLGGTGDMQWFATAEGICRFDGETWTSYPESAYLAGGPGPTAIGPDGALWYGTAKGATRFDSEDWITYTTADGLVANYVLDMVVGPEGAMWFATNGGISRFDGETWTSFTTADGLAHDRVASIALAPDGALWFGTEGGVSRFDGETWTTYTTFDGLISNDVAVVAAAGSVLWFGTAGGVSRFDGETWTSYTSADGLVHDTVSAMEIAPDGAVWFGTEGGLSRYMPAEASDLGYFFSLDREVVDAFWNEDGSLSLAYEFTFTNDAFASPIDFVDVAIPSQDYRLQDISAEVDGHVVHHIAESGFVTGAIELGLGENAILPGGTGRVSVQIQRLQGVLSTDPTDEGYASAVLTPTGFAPEFIHGTTDLTVVFHLPPGVQSDEARWHHAPPGWPAEPTTGLDEQGRITYSWNNPNANGHTQYVFGASFPATYVPEGSIIQPQLALSAACFWLR